jgi:BMFP domain-containing protein YqiC
VAIPPEDQASRVFNQLFLQGSPTEIEAQIREIDAGRSVLDVVADQAKDLQRNIGARDRSRLDQYFSSVRDLEHRLQESRGWANKPKPTVKASPPTDPASPAQYMAKVKNMYDLARLASRPIRPAPLR